MHGYESEGGILIIILITAAIIGIYRNNFVNYVYMGVVKPDESKPGYMRAFIVTLKHFNKEEYSQLKRQGIRVDRFKKLEDARETYRFNFDNDCTYGVIDEYKKTSAS